MMPPILSVTNGVPRHPLYRMKEPVNLSLLRGEQLAIVGRNGAGKSLLVDILTGRWPLLRDEVQYDFSDSSFFSDSSDSASSDSLPFDSDSVSSDSDSLPAVSSPSVSLPSASLPSASLPSASDKVYDNLKYLTFRDSYGDADGSYYYQQRWNSQDAEESPLVRTLLPAWTEGSNECAALVSLLGLGELLDKPVVQLSSGELRKFQLAKALLTRPRILILDNPFIGLDAPTRDWLRDWLGQLIGQTGLQLILVLSRYDELPDFITHVVEVVDRTCGPKLPRAEFLAQCAPLPQRVLPSDIEARILDLPYAEGRWMAHATSVAVDGSSAGNHVSVAAVGSSAGNHVSAPADGSSADVHPLPGSDGSSVIDLHRVSIRYGERTLLRELDWHVRCGERWALSGANGSGKSTLLSLVCADNPQSYACDMALFGRKRGSGESIWEIKQHIGYVSPEMHRAYQKGLPVVDIVASGLHDSVGLYRRPRPEQRAVCETWLSIFGIAELKDRNFLQLSSGEQRLVLLARAFVKDPELLILDEPLHGLDGYHRQWVKEVIEAFCRRRGKTLVMVSHYADEFPACMTHALHLERHPN